MNDRTDLENPTLKVNDRRRFAPDGTPLQDNKERPEFTQEATSPGHIEEPIPADFASLLLSLAAGAQAALGITPNPMTGKLEKNLLQAKYSIDLLALLQEKTQGNLAKEEAKLLEALLYDLRLQYVEASQPHTAEK